VNLVMKTHALFSSVLRAFAGTSQLMDRNVCQFHLLWVAMCECIAGLVADWCSWLA
jgi:hypothetical protein